MEYFLGLIVLAIAFLLICRPFLKNHGRTEFERKSQNKESRRRSRSEAPTGTYLGPEDWQYNGGPYKVFSYVSAIKSSPYSINNLPFASIDFETTGLEPLHKHRVVEVSIAFFDANGVLEGTFSSIVNPGIAIENSGYHGITDSMVAMAPKFETLIPFIQSRLKNRIVISHNAPFEEAFLFHEAQRAGVSFPKFYCVDTLSLSRSLLRELPNHRLPTVCDYLGVDLENPHEALEDAVAAGKIYAKLRERLSLRIPEEIKVFSDESISMPSVQIRPPKLKKGKIGYMADLVRQLPEGDTSRSSEVRVQYFTFLEKLLLDNKIDRDEAKELSAFVTSLGLSSADVKILNEQFLIRLDEQFQFDGEFSPEEKTRYRSIQKLITV